MLKPGDGDPTTGTAAGTVAERQLARPDDGPPDRPRLSVCIACYNQARFLDDAVRSIRDQNFDGVEVILVDDGSTDHTPGWSDRPGVRYVRQAQKGLSAARNTALHLARASYVTFLDADDIYLPDAFATAVAMLDFNADLAFVYGGYKQVDAELNCIRDVAPEVSLDGYAGLLRRNHISMHATVFYRTDALLAVGGFDTSLRACEDYDVYLRLARQAKFGAYDNMAAGYRRHDANMTRNSALMLRSSLTVLKRNRSQAALRPEWTAAYREGMRFWKQHYGSQLASDVMAAAVRGSPQALRLLTTGVLYDWRFARRLLSWRSWLSHLRRARG